MTALTLVLRLKACRPDVETRTLCLPYQARAPEMANVPFLELLVLPNVSQPPGSLTCSFTSFFPPGTRPWAATAPAPA